MTLNGALHSQADGKQQGSKKFRMYNERDETVMHILSESSKLAQTEYKRRHNKVATTVYWELYSKYGFQPVKNFYKHRVEGVIKN